MSEQEKLDGKPKTVSPIKDFGIKLIVFKKTEKVDDDKSIYTYEQQVQDTRMAFIKYCVQLYKVNVEPMIKKLKRSDAPDVDKMGKQVSPFDKMKKSNFA